MAAAASRVPSLKHQRVWPHVIRHTAAAHVLNSGVDLNVIRAWLAHVDLGPTNIYREINLATKRKALDTWCSRLVSPGQAPSWKRDEDLLAWLEHM